MHILRTHLGQLAVYHAEVRELANGTVPSRFDAGDEENIYDESSKYLQGLSAANNAT